MVAHSRGWQKMYMQDVMLEFYDGLHATPKPAKEGPVFLGIKNITDDGRLNLSDVRHIAEEDYANWIKRVTPRTGDIVFSYEATLHLYAIIPEGFRGCLGRRLALIRPNPEVVDTRFLFYHFFGKEWRKTASKYQISGSTVDRIPLITFPKFEVTLPPLPTQRKIAAILSAYDDLIENNTRRIRILEEMAQLLYREWFVHFRFPGHEGVKMVKGVPEGWEVKPFTDVIDVLNGGTPKTSVPEYWGGNIPWFTPRDLENSFYILKTERTITELGLSKCNSKLYPPEAVFITARGTVGKCILAGFPMAMSQTNYALLGHDGMSQYFVFLLTLELAETLKKNATGAVFDTIVVDTFRKQEILIPSQTIMKQFTATVAPVFGMIKNLQLKNANLRGTRDLLLPRLVSGEVDVSEMEGSGVEQTL